MVFVPDRGAYDGTKGKPSSNWPRPTGAQLVVAFSLVVLTVPLTISLHSVHTAYFFSFSCFRRLTLQF